MGFIIKAQNGWHDVEWHQVAMHCNCQLIPFLVCVRIVSVHASTLFSYTDKKYLSVCFIIYDC